MPQSVRRHFRYAIETPVVYSVGPPPDAPPSTARRGRSRNLSEGGLLLEAGESLSPRTRLTRLLIRAKRGAVEGQGEVVWAEGPALKPWLGHGVQITQMEVRYQHALEFFLYEARHEIGRRPIRFDIDIPVICRGQESVYGTGGRAVNASHSGVLVLLPVRFPSGTVLFLEMQTPARSFSIEAVVIRLEGPRADGLVPHGLAFVDLQEGSRLLPELLIVGLI